MINQSIAIGILARNCNSALKENIARVEELGSNFASYNVVAVENDSTDGTKETLEEWSERNTRIVVNSTDTGLDTIPQKSKSIPFPDWSTLRIEKMSRYRNLILDEIKQRFHPDLVCIIDIDLLYFSVDGIVKAIENAPEGWGGLFANGQQRCTVKGRTQQFPTQYDPFAYLEKGKDFRQASSFVFGKEHDLFKGYMMHRMVCASDERYIPCESAFGGVGIYKFECIKDLKYEAYVIPEYEKDSIALCEHVPFNCRISEKGYNNYIAKDIVTVREFWSEKITKGLIRGYKKSIAANIDDKNIAIKSSSPKRYTVLSYIFNGYEQIHEIQKKDPEANYIMVTDDPLLISDTWTIVYDPLLENKSAFDKTFCVRYNCFRYCDTNICLRIDGSIEVKDSLKALIDIFEQGEYDACLMPHPFNDNFLDEYKTWVHVRHYSRIQAIHCIRDMKKSGYDFKYKGLFQLGFSIQRRGTLTDKIDRTTYDYLKKLGRRGKIERLDQIPFSFIMNTKFNNIKILPVSEQILRSYCLQLYEHGNLKKNMNAFYDITKPDIKYMFNKLTACLYLQ